MDGLHIAEETEDRNLAESSSVSSSMARSGGMATNANLQENCDNFPERNLGDMGSFGMLGSTPYDSSASSSATDISGEVVASSRFSIPSLSVPADAPEIFLLSPKPVSDSEVDGQDSDAKESSNEGRGMDEDTLRLRIAKLEKLREETLTLAPAHELEPSFKPFWLIDKIEDHLRRCYDGADVDERSWSLIQNHIPFNPLSSLTVVVRLSDLQY